jgi:electron transport complex protein RnfA
VSFRIAPLALFAVFSGLSVNLVLQFGLGMRGVAISQMAGKKPPLVKLGLLFVSVVLLWVVFSYIVSFLPLGFFTYVFLFPLSSAAYFGFEYLAYRFMVKKNVESDNPIGFRDCLAAAALFITLNVAGGFVEALALCFGFVLGILLVYLILGEIRRRSMLEAVPPFLRGTPITLVSMGLLSLIFSSAALVFFRVLGVE